MRSLLALIFATIPLAAAAQSAPASWALTVWPNAALLAEQVQANGVYSLRQAVTCVPGDNAVAWRRYHPVGQPRPQGSRRGCDTQCRTQVVLTDSDAPRPAGFTERTLTWPEAKPMIDEEARRQLVSLRRSDPEAGALLGLIPRFAKACRLKGLPPPAASPAVPAAAKVDPLMQDASSAKGWQALQPGWRRLPEGARVDKWPSVFAIPAAAWEYGAVSGLISTAAPALVRLEVQGRGGRTGVALISADSSRLLSGEQPVAAGETAVVHLRLKPGAPASILLRNFDNAGVPGALAVSKVEVIAEAALDPAEAARLAPLIR